MLDAADLNVIEQLVFTIEGFIEPCEHEINVCWCGERSQVISGYEILHRNGRGEHTWVTDYDWTEDGEPIRLQRCDKCFTERNSLKEG